MQVKKRYCKDEKTRAKEYLLLFGFGFIIGGFGFLMGLLGVLIRAPVWAATLFSFIVSLNLFCFIALYDILTNDWFGIKSDIEVKKLNKKEESECH